ncbi:DAG protein [Zostera marina]|uniref:DAG protein n=1 Tax=Zostera marina TaxID=29655 RepID=A0A0K9PW98_ZOSMR|nr:DAG protein [Zostera marina]
MALRTLFTATSRSLVFSSTVRSFPLLQVRSLHVLSEKLLSPSGRSTASIRKNGAVRCFSTNRTTSSLNDPSPNWSNRPPKETILLDGCDFEHWLVVVDPPDPNLTRDEIIQSYIATLGKVLPSEEDPKFKIYSVSTKHYFAFGALVSEELSYKLKEIPGVRWVLPDSYLDVKNKDYGGEPFINGEAVPYDPKYHEEWVRNNARANERNKRNDRPRNNDRSRNFERRRENMQQQSFQSGTPPPSPMMSQNNSPSPVGNFAGPPRNNSYQGAPSSAYQAPPSNGGYQGMPPPPPLQGGAPGGVGYQGMPPPPPLQGGTSGSVGYQGMPPPSLQGGGPVGGGYQGMPPPPHQGGPSSGGYQGMPPPPYQGGSGSSNGYQGMPPPQGRPGPGYQGMPPPPSQGRPGNDGYQGMPPPPPSQGRPGNDGYQGMPPPPQGGFSGSYQGMPNNNPGDGYQGSGSTTSYQGRDMPGRD